ncbi:KIR protein [Plasmodium coatneyi]|uniref:KIR protein n=1 Tax=Plasmodium coatneyi TaxID=208452 RepID=A0A1B1E7R7_9APIC|nr:KIR protein [Plasmodium coatneyi]ANQ11084.1 KIR protein [Plasmodium coatneyi]
MSETAPVAPATCTLDSIQKQLNLINDFYSNFKNNAENQGDGGTEGAQLTSELRTACSNCTKITGDAKGIENAYLYACQQNGQSDYGDSPCRLFYYWFGHKYWSHLKGNALSTVLDKIYTTLKGSCTKGECTFKYDITDQTIFDHMKIIFEYYNDYNQVQSELSRSGITCAKKWSDYWTKLSTACEKMKEKCKEGSDDREKQYCKDFDSTYKIHCETANLPQQMTELITKIQREAQLAAQTAATLATKEKDEANLLPSSLDILSFLP